MSGRRSDIQWRYGLGGANEDAINSTCADNTHACTHATYAAYSIHARKQHAHIQHMRTAYSNSIMQHTAYSTQHTYPSHSCIQYENDVVLTIWFQCDCRISTCCCIHATSHQCMSIDVRCHECDECEEEDGSHRVQCREGDRRRNEKKSVALFVILQMRLIFRAADACACVHHMYKPMQS